MESKNYTELPTELVQQKTLNKKSNVLTFLLVNISAFIGGLTIVLLAYITITISSSSTNFNNNLKASEQIVKTECFNDNIDAPKDVRAFVEKEKSVLPFLNGSKLKTNDEISFIWNEIPNATTYYVALGKDGKYIDPVTQLNSSTNEAKFTFSKLEPKTNYQLFIRSQAKNGRLSLVLPTPTNCKFFITGDPVFEFNTE